MLTAINLLPQEYQDILNAIVKLSNKGTEPLPIGRGRKQTVNKPDAYVKAVSFGLPAENKDAKNTLKGIGLFPYTISLSRVNTMIQTGKFYWRFDYDITRNSDMATNTDGHKLLLVFEDHSGTVSFERPYNLNSFESNEDDNKESQIEILSLSSGRSHRLP